MPHAELKYSTDLTVDAVAILKTIETIINEHDPGAGKCKGRVYPAEGFHHTHLLVEISMLPKTHRDEAFTQKLMEDLEAAIKAQIPQPCFFSMGIAFSLRHYVTNEHSP